jgi:hypothetical protein
LHWDSVGKTSHIDAADYQKLVQYIHRCKAAPASDALTLDAPENNSYGTKDGKGVHFDSGWTAQAVHDLKGRFPKEYALYYDPYKKAAESKEMQAIIGLMNPMRYLYYKSNARDLAPYWYIRDGSKDTAASHSVSFNIYLGALKNGAKNAYFSYKWDMGHGDGYDLDKAFAYYYKCFNRDKSGGLKND